MLSKMCQDAKQKIMECIANYNTAYAAGDLKTTVSIEASVKEAESEYAKQAQLDLFSSHKDEDNPAMGILKEGFYGVVRHKPVREDGRLIGWELVDGEKPVDLKAMFAYLNHQSKVWQYRCERFTEVLVEWVCEDVGQDSSTVKDTFKMSGKAKEIDVGPKPTSNTSMLKLLQSCIDEIVSSPDGDGKNTIRVNNRDLKFIQHCFSGEGNGRTNLKTMKSNGVIRVIGKVLYRVLNGYAYSVDFKHIVEKSDALEAQRAANRKAKEAKAATEAKADPEPIVVPVPVETEKTEGAA